jgi:hypothetical protein
MRSLFITAAAALTLLAGCGGADLGTESGGSSSTGTTGTTGTTGGSTTYELGNGTGSSFKSGTIGVTGTQPLSAGGTITLTLTVVNQSGVLYTAAPVVVSYSSTCISNGEAVIAPSGTSTAGSAADTVTSSTGTIEATYTAKGCSGSDVITATATVGSQTLTASGTVSVALAAIGSISFISASPPQISLKGVGVATSTVTFQVNDTSGNPRAGAPVTFALSTEVGGISISPMTATSLGNGQVTTVVSAGTVATTIRVTATTTTSSGTKVSTQSNALVVSTGIPTSANVSLAVKCQNVEAWNYDGVTVPVTLSMTDRFSNPVPDGTTANFRTALGGIQASCQTGSATYGSTSGSGACVINWTSKAPYSIDGNPQTTSGNANVNKAYCSGAGQAMGLCNTTTNGRSAIYATAIGEESFNDATGTGYFNPGDTVAWDAADADNNFPSGKPKPWQDTSEPFLNEWELYDSYGTPTYVFGEPYLDFNDNGKRDDPDGLVESALCQGPLCDTSSSTVAVSASNLIILSGSTSNVYVYTATQAGGYPILHGIYGTTLAQTSFHYAEGDATGASGGGLALDIYIYDDRLQQMPNATTLSFTLSTGMTASITSQAPGAVPCSTAGPVIDGNGLLEAGQFYTVTIAPPATAPTTGLVGGTLYLSTTSPRGLITTTPISLIP